MIAMVVAVTLIMGVSEWMLTIQKQTQQVEVIANIETIRNKLLAAITGTQAQCNTFSTSANAALLLVGNPNFGCSAAEVPPGSGCGTLAGPMQAVDLAGNPIGGTSAQLNSNTGFNLQGASCTTFNAAKGSGSDQCPFQYQMTWATIPPNTCDPTTTSGSATLSCPTNNATPGCAPGEIFVTGTLIYNPSSPGLVFGRLNPDQFQFTNEPTQIGTDPSVQCLAWGWFWQPNPDWGHCVPPFVANPQAVAPDDQTADSICTMLGGKWNSIKGFCGTQSGGVDVF